MSSNTSGQRDHTGRLVPLTRPKETTLFKAKVGARHFRYSKEKRRHSKRRVAEEQFARKTSSEPFSDPPGPTQQAYDKHADLRYHAEFLNQHLVTQIVEPE